jgi:hypothetical protein
LAVDDGGADDAAPFPSRGSFAFDTLLELIPKVLGALSDACYVNRWFKKSYKRLPLLW